MPLHSVRQFHGLAVEMPDGALGRVRDALFDDDEWVLRHIVVETGDWFDRREILVPPASVLRIDWGRSTVYVNLSRQQVTEGPRLDATRPVLREHEIEFLDHYGYTHYWTGLSVDDMAALATEDVARREMTGNDSRLHSTREMLGCSIRTVDGVEARIEDMRFDAGGWPIQWLVVDSGDWSQDRSVLVSPTRVERVDWEEGKVILAMSRDDLEGSPKA